MKKSSWLIVCFVIICISLGIYFNKTNKNNEEIKKEDYVVEILKYDLENVNQEFLNWVNLKYPKTLKEILNNLKNNNYKEDDWYNLTHNSFKVLIDLEKGSYENQNNVKIINTDEDIVLAFVGDVSLADNYFVMPEYDKRGKGILGILDEEVLNSLRKSTVAIANNEFTVSTRGEPLKGKAFTFRAQPERLKIYDEMGIDLVTLANNHVFDYGKDAFLDMLEELDKIKMPHVGAGKNITDAATPFYFIIGGRKLAFVNANRSEKNILTPGASEDSPGVLRCYDPTYFNNLIKETKKNSDYVFALVHWGKEGSNSLEEEQIKTAQMYLESGADAIIGTHAHVLQEVDFYQNKLIAYNLGNFIFNNKTIETGILKLEILKDGSLKYYFEPCLQSNVYTQMLKEEEKLNLIKKMNNWSKTAEILETGEIVLKS